MESKKVNLFVIGAMKAGTTSFMERLAQHPEVYVSPVKEPHFFIDELPANLYEPPRFFNLERYLEKDFPEPLHICKIETASQYEKLFSLAEGQKYRTEGSTAYLHAPESPRFIYEYDSEAKVIILLRDPMKRAFSHYQMDLGKGREKDSFEKLVQKEIALYESGQLLWNSYLGMSFYNDAVDRFKTLFADSVVVKFEDLVQNPEAGMQDVSEFLNIASFEALQNAPKNVSRSLRFQKLFYFLKQLGLKDYFSKLFGSKFKQWVFRKVSTEKKSDMGLSPETISKLESIFAKESGQCYY